MTISSQFVINCAILLVSINQIRIHAELVVSTESSNGNNSSIILLTCILNPSICSKPVNKPDPGECLNGGFEFQGTCVCPPDYYGDICQYSNFLDKVDKKLIEKVNRLDTIYDSFGSLPKQEKNFLKSILCRK